MPCHKTLLPVNKCAIYVISCKKVFLHRGIFMKVFWLLLLLCLSACAGKSVETGFHEFKFDENGDAISFVYSDDDKGIVMGWQKIDEGVYKSVRRSLDGVITEWKY